MYSELLFGHKRIKASIEGFQFAESYVHDKTGEKIIKVITEQFEYFQKLKKENSSVSAKVIDYKILTDSINEFAILIPANFPKPSMMYRDKNMFFRVVGELINRAAHDEYIKFKNNMISIVELPEKNSNLKDSKWNNPTTLKDTLIVQVDYMTAMMKNLARMKPEKGYSETTRKKIITLSESIVNVVNELTGKYVETIHNFCIELEKGSTKSTEEEEKETSIKKRNFLKEYKQAIK